MGKADKKDADRAKAEKRLEQEISAGQTEEELARAEKRAEGMSRGVNTGEAQLFEKKLSKEEKKAAMEIKKAEIAAKKAAKKAAAEGGDAAAEGDGGDGGGGGDEERSASPSKSTKGAAGAVAAAGEKLASLTLEQQRVAAARAVTGVLASHAAALDVKIQSFSISVGGNQLLQDCELELCQGCRYGLIGENGSGKSNVLAAIAQRDVPLPSHVDVFHLHEEARPYLPRTSRAPPAHLPCTSRAPPVHLPRTSRAPPVHLPRTSRASPAHLPYIAPASPLHLPCISPASPLHLAQAPASEMSGVEAVIHHVTLEAARLEARCGEM
jgi:hypothetical protein